MDYGLLTLAIIYSAIVTLSVRLELSVVVSAILLAICPFLLSLFTAVLVSSASQAPGVFGIGIDQLLLVILQFGAGLVLFRYLDDFSEDIATWLLVAGCGFVVVFIIMPNLASSLPI